VVPSGDRDQLQGAHPYRRTIFIVTMMFARALKAEQPLKP